MSEIFTFTKTLKIEECCRCHMTFAMTQEFMKEKRDDHSAFYCPEGHRQYYLHESNEQKLQKQLTVARNDTERFRESFAKEHQAHETTRHQRNALKGIVKRTKSRIGNGVCPCCNRQFTDLHRHMESKHPDFTGETK